MGKPGAKKNNNSKANLDNDKYYNLLFLGQTGVGKSTFINAFVNYLRDNTLETARNSQAIVLIKSKFVVTDENLVEKVISVTGDANISNESDILADSATQKSTVYIFPLLGKKTNLRLIDTPGIGDTRGIDQDEQNCDDILQTISRYDEIHAICILLSPNHARLTAQFEFCLKQLLSRLDKSAIDNIIFVFTNSRSSFYRPGDTLPALQRLLQNIRKQSPTVDIQVTKENTYCMDNEPFRFLMAMKQVHFTDDEIAQFARSWDVSREVCLRLLTYIMGDENNPGLKPHLTSDTLSINKARRLIMQLAQPLADISQLICDNVYALDQHMKRLNRENQSLSDLKRNMFIPVIDIKETQFSEPRTVCADLKCTTTYTVQGRKKCHYSQRCHDPCYLRNVPREIIGSPELLHCAAMHGTKCQQCGCDYGKHMHIYYETTVYETEIKDDNVVSEITNRQGAVKQVEALVGQMQSLKKEREEEHEFILNALATFAWFLKSQAITAYNDAYSTYVGYLIDREKSRGDDADQFAINHLQTALRRYEEFKKILDSAKENSKATINAAAITDLTSKLFKLKHCGMAIKKLYEGQSHAHIAETENFEYVHDVGLSLAPKPEPPTPQTNRNNRNSDDTQRQQNKGRNSQNQPKNNNPQKGQNKQQQNQQGNYKKNWKKPQQNQNRWQGQQQTPYQQSPPPLFQQQPPPWQQQPQSYNNYQPRPPQNYYHYPQGPQFNCSPGGNQQNWPNQMNQGYYPNQQQQFQPPPPYQQRYQQQYNRSGPPRRNSFSNEAGPSKESSFEAPTGVYNPKPKKNAERNNTQSLEEQLSSMNVQEPQDRAPTQYDNQNRNRRPRYDSDQHFHQIRGRNNFKRNQGRHNNSQQQGRNYNKNGNDDDGEDEDNNDTEGQTDGQGYRKMRKNDFVKQTVALAVIEQSRPPQEGENGASGSSMVTVNEANPEKAISFFRKLFR